MRRTVLTAIITMLLLAACGGADSGAESAEAGGGDAGVAAGGQEAAAPEDTAAQDAAAEEAGAGTADGSAGGDGDAATIVLAAAGVDQRIIRDGTMTVEVEAFDRALRRIAQTAERLGGSVLTTTSTTDDDGATSGSVGVRVPFEQYDELLTTIPEIGEVRDRLITAEDVSVEFVDLQARLRHNEAQERFYLSLLDRADDVEDAIAVQQRVADIQQTIEQIRGRLRFLEERTSFSRLTVELFEAGAPAIGPGDRPSLAAYWDTATAGLITALGAVLVVVTVVGPFALAAGAAFLAWRALRRRDALPAPRQTAAAE